MRRAADKRAAVPVGIALAIVVDVARALHHAHVATGDDGTPLGIVHRDVKPSNVLLSWVGDVKLTDFGIALSRDRIKATTEGMTKGTPGFMSPEQLTGAPVDARTDVFALGCTLHALLTGRSPAQATEAMVRMLAGMPLAVDPGLDADVRALVERAVAPRGVDRHPSALAFADEAARAMASRLRRDARGELSDWLASLRGEAPAPPPVATRTKLAQARSASGARTFAVAVAVTLGLGATFGVAGASLWWRRAKSPGVPDATTTPPAPPSASEPDASPAEPTSVSPLPPPVESVAPRPVPARIGRHCTCVERRPGFRQPLCKELGRPRCACWYPSNVDIMRELLCATPFTAGGACTDDVVEAKDGDPCTGYRYRVEPTKTFAGKRACSRCVSVWPTAPDGEPCTGIDPDTRAERKGTFVCDE